MSWRDETKALDGAPCRVVGQAHAQARAVCTEEGALW